MKKEINISKNIVSLRKRNRLTQDQLAKALNVSPQAVSKWETGTCQPDTLTLPLIADYFHVSIDYLFYGCEKENDEIYEKVTNRIAEFTNDAETPYDEAFRVNLAALHGVLLRDETFSKYYKKDINSIERHHFPVHIINDQGLAVTDKNGFSAMVSKDYLDSVDGSIMNRARKVFEVLSNEDCLRVIMEILNFNGISHYDMKEKTQFDEERLKNAIDECKKARLIHEISTRYAVLGGIYSIQRHHYNGLCLILATIKMIEISRRGASRYMDYMKNLTMSFDIKEEDSNLQDGQRTETPHDSI